MVSFICGNCQEVLKKNKVDSHCVGNCSYSWEFTCIDCNVTFSGFEYRTHNKCITEEEKYHGKFSKISKKKSDKRYEHDKNTSHGFVKLINEILRENGPMSWKDLRDASVSKYCRRNNISIRNNKFRRKLNWECLSSVPIDYTCEGSNLILLSGSL